MHAGLTIADHEGVLHPQLAELVPSIENGSWTLFPDGRMETTWRLKETARWHDGTPVTAADLLFTAGVLQDAELPFTDQALALVGSMEAVDARTLRVHWPRPFVEADALFGGPPGRASMKPLPRHLLEAPYWGNKAAFLAHPYWGDAFVGAGPYTLREWVRDSHIVLDAYADYVLGRPKLDGIDVKLIADPTTLMGAILASAVDLPLGTRALSFEEGVELRAQWKEGVVSFGGSGGAASLFPQLLTPRPAIVGNASFRRALLHAIDRQELSDTLMAGEAPIAHNTISPGERAYTETLQRTIRYAYDPRQAAQLLSTLGFAPGADGGLRDGTGGRLEVEVRSNVRGLYYDAKLATAGYWGRVGVATTLVDDTEALRRNREYRASFPGFDLSGTASGTTALRDYHSAQIPTTDNRFAGRNRARYANAELDALIDQYLVAIRVPDRDQVVANIVRHLTEQVIPLPLIYNPRPIVMSSRLLHVPMRIGEDSSGVWNAHLWDLR
jgi:peptide/nickel transport system substrate-binding protein